MEEMVVLTITDLTHSGVVPIGSQDSLTATARMLGPTPEGVPIPTIPIVVVVDMALTVLPLSATTLVGTGGGKEVVGKLLLNGGCVDIDFPLILLIFLTKK